MAIMCFDVLNTRDGPVTSLTKGERRMRWPSRTAQEPGYSWTYRGQVATFPTPELADAALRNPALNIALE